MDIGLRLQVHINFDALHRIQNGVPNFHFSSRQELISHFEYFNEKTAQKNKKKTIELATKFVQ